MIPGIFSARAQADACAREGLDTLPDTDLRKAYDLLVQINVSSLLEQFSMAAQIRSSNNSTVNCPIYFADRATLVDRISLNTTQIVEASKELLASYDSRLKIFVLSKKLMKESDQSTALYFVNKLNSAFSSTEKTLIQKEPSNSSFGYTDLDYPKIANALSANALFSIDVIGADSVITLKTQLFLLGKDDGKTLSFPTTSYDDITEETIRSFAADYTKLFEYFIDVNVPGWNWRNVKAYDSLLKLPSGDLLVSAKKFYGQSQHALANQLLFRMLEKEKNADAYVYLISGKMKQGRLAEARFLGNVSTNLFPGDYRLHLLLAYTLIRLQNPDGAIKQLEGIITKDKFSTFENVGSAAVVLSQAYILSKKYPYAISTLKDYLAKNPNDALANYYLGKCYYYNSNYESAETVLSKVDTSAITDKDLRSDLRITLSRVYSEQAKIRLNSKRDSVNFYLNKSGQIGKAYDPSMTYIQQQIELLKFREADSVLDLCLDQKIFSPWRIYYSLGFNSINLATSMKNKEAAQKAYEKAIEYLLAHLTLSPSDHRARWLIGNTDIGMGEYIKGFMYLKSAFDLDSTKIAYRFDLAEANLFIKNYPRALKLVNDNQLKLIEKLYSKSYYAVALYIRSMAKLMTNQQATSELERLDKLAGSNQKFVVWDFQQVKDWIAQQNLNRVQTAGIAKLMGNMNKLFKP